MITSKEALIILRGLSNHMKKKKMEEEEEEWTEEEMRQDKLWFELEEAQRDGTY